MGLGKYSSIMKDKVNAFRSPAPVSRHWGGRQQTASIQDSPDPPEAKASPQRVWAPGGPRSAPQPAKARSARREEENPTGPYRSATFHTVGATVFAVVCAAVVWAASRVPSENLCR